MKLLCLVSLVAVVTAYPADVQDVVTQWESTCGESMYPDAGREPVGTDIHGGWDARKGEFPWQVSMRNSDTSDYHYCGAVIMNAGWIVTAAHCCQGALPVDIYLVVGEHDFTESDAENPQRTVHRVTEKYIHEEYGSVTLVNDICLLQLVSNITFNQYVQPACQPQPMADVNATKPEDYNGAMAAVHGWGDTESSPANVLKTTNMPVVTNQVCYDEIAVYEPTWIITPDMICAGYIPTQERDSCQGDSGGPLVTKNTDTGLWELIGLVSFGYGCAAGPPGVYHRTSHSLEWVNSKLYP